MFFPRRNNRANKDRLTLLFPKDFQSAKTTGLKQDRYHFSKGPFPRCNHRSKQLHIYPKTISPMQTTELSNTDFLFKGASLDVNHRSKKTLLTGTFTSKKRSVALNNTSRVRGLTRLVCTWLGVYQVRRGPTWRLIFITTHSSFLPQLHRSSLYRMQRSFCL